jgi:hypothetical protein
MNLDILNQITNDILVCRLEIAALQAEKDEIYKNHERFQKIDQLLNEIDSEKNALQINLLSLMKENGLKSWKTDKANYARVTKDTVVLNPAYKKAIEQAVKGGELIDGWEVKKTEYISIKINGG